MASSHTYQNSGIRLSSPTSSAAFSHVYPHAVDKRVDKHVNCLQNHISGVLALALHGGVGYIPYRG
jgi:hypothetical protein